MKIVLRPWVQRLLKKKPKPLIHVGEVTRVNLDANGLYVEARLTNEAIEWMTHNQLGIYLREN